MGFKLIKVGRGKDNDIVLGQGQISTHHAEFFMDESGLVFLTDMNSKNGTYVNNIRLTSSIQLKPNDKVMLGSIEVDWMDYLNIKTKGADLVSKNYTQKRKKPVVIPLYVYIIIATVFFCGGIFAINEFLLSKEGQVHSESSNTSITSEDKEITSGNEQELEPIIPQNIEYDYACLGTDLLNEASSLEAELIDMSGVTVTVSEEQEMGKEVYDLMKKEYSFVQGNKLSRCSKIMNNLIPHIKNPKGFSYKIYVLDTDMINAFTAGGYIFVTTGIIDFSKSDSELACIIGHEIAHNERGHIRRNLKKHKFNQGLFGDFFGEMATGFSTMLTAPFNQKNETESDYYGIGYAYGAGYDACVSIDLWKRMSKDESEFNHLDNMMRTHPFSIKRSECCRSHIETNYNKTCP